MQIQTFTLGELQTNCYLVGGLIIDPGDEANFISEQILRLGIKPVAIVATHGHFDHILAANELQLAFRIPFLIHPKDLFLVKNLQKNASFWTERRIVERGPGEIGDLRDFGGVGGDGGFGGLKVIQTPGHTPGSVCLYFEKEEVLFTGDTLFADGVGRTDFSYGSEKDLLASLEKLSKLPPKIKIYPGHGESGIKLGDLTRGRKNVEWRTEDEE